MATANNNVISYYQPILGEEFSKQSEELIPLWKHTWKQQGWNPIVLDERNAIENSIYNKLDFNDPNSNFYKENPVGSFEYNRSCYLRLLAYCEYVKQNGPTVYCDYDVMNYEMKPDALQKITTNSLFCEQRSTVYLDENGANDMEQALTECFHAKKLEWCHRNDMRLMEHKTKLFTPLVDNNNDYIYCCSSHTPRDTITPLVHYNGGCYLRGASKHLSRAEVIIEHGRIKL